MRTKQTGRRGKKKSASNAEEVATAAGPSGVSDVLSKGRNVMDRKRTFPGDSTEQESEKPNFGEASIKRQRIQELNVVQPVPSEKEWVKPGAKEASSKRQHIQKMNVIQPVPSENESRKPGVEKASSKRKRIQEMNVIQPVPNANELKKPGAPEASIKPQRTEEMNISQPVPGPHLVKGKRLPSGKKNRRRDMNVKEYIGPVKTPNGSKDGTAHLSEEAEVVGSKDPRAPRTIFIGNIPVGTKMQAIKRLTGAHGIVESVRLRGVVPEGPGVPKREALLSGRLHQSVDTISAYVVFAGPDGEQAVEKACDAMNMSVLGGKHLRVTPAQELKMCPHRSVFVGNLPFDVSEEALLDAFQKALESSDCKITAVRVVRDRATGIGRGIGFVSFDDELGVRCCMSLKDKITVAGRPVRLDTADKGQSMTSKLTEKHKKKGKPASFYKKRQRSS